MKGQFSIDRTGRVAIRALLVSLCVAASVLTNADVYSWKDEQGVTHFSYKRPNDTQAQIKKIASSKGMSFSIDQDGNLIDTKSVQQFCESNDFVSCYNDLNQMSDLNKYLSGSDLAEIQQQRALLQKLLLQIIEGYQ